MELKHYMLELKGPAIYAHVWAETMEEDKLLRSYVFKINGYITAMLWTYDVIRLIEDASPTIGFYPFRSETNPPHRAV